LVWYQTVGGTLVDGTTVMHLATIEVGGTVGMVDGNHGAVTVDGT